VDSHVIFEVAAQAERALADGALVWFLARVYREVVAQIALLLEAFLACWTAQETLAVGAFVLTQIPLLVERLHTGGACVEGADRCAALIYLLLNDHCCSEPGYSRPRAAGLHRHLPGLGRHNHPRVVGHALYGRRDNCPTRRNDSIGRRDDRARKQCDSPRRRGHFCR